MSWAQESLFHIMRFRFLRMHNNWFFNVIFKRLIRFWKLEFLVHWVLFVLKIIRWKQALSCQFLKISHILNPKVNIFKHLDLFGIQLFISNFFINLHFPWLLFLRCLREHLLYFMQPIPIILCNEKLLIFSREQRIFLFTCRTHRQCHTFIQLSIE